MDKVSKVAQVVGFNKVHVVLVDARAVEFSRVHAKVFNKVDVKDFKVAQAVEFSKVHV